MASGEISTTFEEFSERVWERFVLHTAPCKLKCDDQEYIDLYKSMPARNGGTWYEVFEDNYAESIRCHDPDSSRDEEHFEIGYYQCVEGAAAIAKRLAVDGEIDLSHFKEAIERSHKHLKRALSNGSVEKALMCG